MMSCLMDDGIQEFFIPHLLNCLQNLQPCQVILRRLKCEDEGSDSNDGRLVDGWFVGLVCASQ